MLPGINQWAFPADMPATKAISLAKHAGFSAFEVCLGDTGPTSLDISESEATAIRKHAEAEGVALCSVGCGMGFQYRMTSLYEPERAKAKEIQKQALQVTKWLGADALLVVPGTVDAKTPYDAAIENCLDCLAELAPVAEKLNVSLAIENVWNKFLLSPVEMRDFIDQCDSSHVGAYFDTGNILLYGYPEQWIRILGSRIRAVHLKDFRTDGAGLSAFIMLMEGDVNWPAVMQALRDIDYNRALTAEFGQYKYSLETMLEHVMTAQRRLLAL